MPGMLEVCPGKTHQGAEQTQDQGSVDGSWQGHRGGAAQAPRVHNTTPCVLGAGHRAVGQNGPQVGFSPTLLSLCLLPFSSSSLFKWETCRCRTKEHFVVSACLLAFTGTQLTVPGVSEKTLDLGFCTMMLE